MLVEMQVMVISCPPTKAVPSQTNYCELQIGGVYKDTITFEQAQSTIETFGLLLDEETIIAGRTVKIYR